jgi:hypothetical protein
MTVKQNCMKKRMFALIAVCFLLAFSFVAYASAVAHAGAIAYADAISGPDNNFLSQHRDDCLYLGRSFFAETELSVKNRPGSVFEIAPIASGEVIYMNYSCLYKGTYWGYSWQHVGWVKLDGLLVLYDYVACQQDHFDDFYLYAGDRAEIRKTKAAIAWPWPGADSPLWTIEDLDISSFRVLHAYEDEAGREWGFVAFLYGSQNIWFCLSDPMNRDMPVFNPAPKPTAWIPETAHKDIGKAENPMLVLIIVLVAALVIGTMILIKVIWKPSENKLGGNGNG